MQRILAQIADHGAVPTTKQDCRLVDADMDGAFPEGFYSTTNQRTEIRLDGHWIEVADQEMDCGIVVEGARCRSQVSARSDTRHPTPRHLAPSLHSHDRSPPRHVRSSSATPACA